MTNLRLLLFIGSALFAANLYAGQEIASAKEKVPMAVETCFKEHEWQLDIFGAYADGNALDHAGPLQDHGWGGGVGVNYFFTRMLGVGADGLALYGRENRQHDDEGRELASAKHTTTWGTNGSVILRFPIDRLCLAPYVYAGGGAYGQGDQWASAHGGVGIEYRVVPNKIAIFADGRWDYYGARYSHDNQNDFIVRSGLRIIF